MKYRLPIMIAFAGSKVYSFSFFSCIYEVPDLQNPFDPLAEQTENTGADEGDAGNADEGDASGAVFRFDFPVSGTVLSDDSGNENVASLGGDAAVLGDSTNQYLWLDGDGDHMRVRFTESFQPSDGLTFYAWVRPESLSGQNIIMRTVWSEGDQYLRFSDGGTAIQFTASIDGYSHYLVTIEPLQVLDGKWHQIAATFDGTTRRVYLDGALLDSMNNAGTVSGGPFSEIYIGCFVDYPSYMEFYHGGLDDLRLYDTALSGSEILADYEARAQ